MSICYWLENLEHVLKNVERKHTSKSKHLLFQSSYQYQPHFACFYMRHARSLQYISHCVLITIQFKGSSISPRADQ